MSFRQQRGITTNTPGKPLSIGNAESQLRLVIERLQEEGRRGREELQLLRSAHHSSQASTATSTSSSSSSSSSSYSSSPAKMLEQRRRGLRLLQDSVRGLGADGRQLLRTAAANGTPPIPLERLRSAFENEISLLQKIEPQLRLAVDQAERQARTAPPAVEELACVLDDDPSETAPLNGGGGGDNQMVSGVIMENGPSELAREQAIRREQGIRRVFGDVQTVQKMFVDMAQVVAEQGEQVSSLGGHVQQARDYTDAALEEVSIAQRRRERTRKTLIRNGQFLGCALLLLFTVWHFCVPSFASIFGSSSNSSRGENNNNISSSSSSSSVTSATISSAETNTLPMGGPIPQPDISLQDIRVKKR